MNKIDNLIIREIYSHEIHILEDMLYESIYQTDKSKPIPRDVINIPKVRNYIKDFEQKAGDYCLVGEKNNEIIGAVWVRLFDGEIKGFGYINDKTPEFAIALYKKYRNQGIGTLMMQKMISYLKDKGYQQASLSVQKENYAVNLYKNLGFKIIDENDQDYIMLLTL